MSLGSSVLIGVKSMRVAEPGLFMEDASDAEPGVRRYVRVAVEQGVDVPGGLTYCDREGICEPGDRVRVRLGTRQSSGIVVARGGPELLEGLSPSRVRPILAHQGRVLPGPLVDLARWMSEYYLCPLGMVLATMVPAAVKRGVGARRRERLQPVDRARADRILKGTRLPPTTKRAWEAIVSLKADVFPVDASELKAMIGASTLGGINRLVRLGLLEQVSDEVVRVHKVDGAATNLAGGQDFRHVPTAAQQHVVDGILGSLPGFGVHLIHGVTGSGKTEVYMRLIERVLADGRTALVLVPEIALTPQTSARFLGRFREAGVAVLHSALTGSERHHQWRRVLAGEARVVVGARSAVFAPLTKLGMIVIDEEHDASYKQDQLPRYHARDTAIKRAQIEGACVVLGSATPSLESYRHGLDGRYRLWRLHERVGGGRLPTVRVVDLVQDRSGDVRQDTQRLQTIGPTLDRAIRRTLADGRQVILLLNRRGWAGFVGCSSSACGWRLQCDACDASMVVHRSRDFPAGRLVRCHHCLAQKLVPAMCPACARVPICLGAGGQRVEDELAEGFGLVAGETMLRIDADTMQSGRDYFDALERFRTGRVRVLVGTQMIAKGLDFPGVRLVGVISADTALSLPDFRAAERTFQLISQVAGRAGRSDEQGEVIVQTLNPDEPAIRFACAHDFENFARMELDVRRRAGLPPVVRMARIVLRDRAREKAKARGEDVARVLRDLSEARSVRVEGPMECPLARLHDHYRFEVIVMAPTARAVVRLLNDARRVISLHGDAQTSIDVDPVSML